MKIIQIAMSVLFVCLLLTGCGRKMMPKPPEDEVVTYPRFYPNPDLEE